MPKVTKLSLICTLAAGIGLATLSNPVFANTGSTNTCGGVDTAILKCSQKGASSDITDSGFWGILQIVLNIMVIGVGVGAVGGFVYAGILYASAGDSQEQVKKALDTIRNVVIGLVLFAVMFIAVNYLVPGGILG
ncbi:hypothetical protein GX865_04205 [Candidatus Saccharibacteria bacterium]|jgi:hypothetical protein|nr:hypothetical protein [Candidatus Saccharibacteria bacterium]